MTRLSKRTVDALSPAETDYFEWDSELPGFGIRIMPTGRKTYMIQYRDDGGRTRRKRLGRHGVVTAEDARKDARELLASVARGAPARADEGGGHCAIRYRQPAP